MEVSQLEDALLDYWVAKAAGVIGIEMRDGYPGIPGWRGGDYNGSHTWEHYNPSRNWGIAGSIIERERIGFYDDTVWPAPGVPPTTFSFAAGYDAPNQSNARFDREWYGPTPLVAAMRCFVAQKFGESVPDVDFA
jgi:hypothetical protein